MKKYNTFKSKWLILGIIILFLMFLFAIKFIYPFLGAKLNTVDKSIGTAVVTISCNNSNAVERRSTSITPSSTKILPGDVLKASTTIKNTGEADIYCVFQVQIAISSATLATQEVVNKYYTYNGSTYIELIKSGSVYIQEAYALESNEDFSVTIPVTLEGNYYGNEYKNATLTCTVTALGIQQTNIASAIVATNEIMSMI